MLTLKYKNKEGLYLDHKGNAFGLFSDMCAYWGKRADTVRQRLKKGLDLEEALSTPLTVLPRHDYTDPKTGAKLHGLSEIADYYHCPRWVLGNLVSKYKYPLESAVKMARHYKPKIPVRDHLGHKYQSYKDMAAAWGINALTLHGRIAAGWSVEKALTTAVKHHLSRQKANKCKSSKGEH